MSWDISSLLAKAFTLMALAGVVGGIFCLFLTTQSGLEIRRHLLGYIKAGAFIGIFASSLFFFVQVGAINQSGLSGMLDKTMISILAQSGLGFAALYRFIAFFMILSLAIYKTRLSRKNELTFGNFSLLIFSVAILLLAYSFSLIGHVAELSWLAATAIGFHILAISLWLGSLYPLWYLCKQEELIRLRKLMQRFGELAMIFVGVLIISGVYLVMQLLESPLELVSTAYGLTLLLKLTGVLALLFMGALNKLRLVPELTDEKGIKHLQRSITLEIALAFIVLLITAYLTTLVGLSHSS
tara:strand:- start:612 stop:1505 length:894 start_codon:yes stop_codon:yes gene_type:complete